jgi:microcystin-dependent protein
MSVDGTIGEIRAFAGFVPRNWLPCDGSMLQIRQNTALFSLIGIAYGGDGKLTFALPNLSGAVGIGIGPAANGPATALGSKVGLETVTLASTEVPPHSHALQRKRATDVSQKISNVSGTANVAQISHTYGTGQHEVVEHLLQNVAPNTTLDTASMSGTMGGQPHENRQPYQVLNYGICVSGIFPSRP